MPNISGDLVLGTAPMRCLALLALLVSTAALRVSPLTSRRQAVAAGAGLVPALLLPQIAHADKIEEIAARSNAAAEAAVAAKAKAKAEGPGFIAEATSGIAGVALPAALLGLLGFAVVFVSDITGKSGIGEDFAKKGRRELTDAEKRKYKGLSAKEKAELGIKGL
tara:strand:+ start:92 stop:586 length:495 start_codon:yes stop_codon:yes gene_type:complete